jgi:hypothetical protein
MIYAFQNRFKKSILLKIVEYITKKNMQKSQLIQVVRTFSKKDFRDFRKWITSPMHNQREDVVKLFDYLCMDEHFQKEEMLDKSLIYRYLSPGEKFDDAKIRQTMFFFMECIDDFFFYQEFLEEELQKNIFLARNYKKRGLNKVLKKNLNTFLEKKDKNPIFSDKLFLAEYEIQKELFDYNYQHERSQDTNFDAMQEVLDHYYIVNKLRLACVALNHTKVFKVNYELTFIDEVFDFIKTRELENPLINCYYTILNALKFPEEEIHFKNLQEKITNDAEKFLWKDAREIYLMAINYGASKLNQGKSEYRRDVFNLYKNGIEIGVLLENNILSPYTFKNVVTLGIHLQELAWVENFIHENKDKLEESNKKGTVDFNLAMLYYTKKDYKKAQRLLASFEVDDLLITLNAKFLLIKIYVEENEYDLLDTHIATMRVYLNRKELLGYYKTLYKNVIHFTKKINRIAPFTKVEKEKLIKDIKEATPLADKEWFIRQVGNL